MFLFGLPYSRGFHVSPGQAGALSRGPRAIGSAWSLSGQEIKNRNLRDRHYVYFDKRHGAKDTKILHNFCETLKLAAAARVYTEAVRLDTT